MRGSSSKNLSATTTTRPANSTKPCTRSLPKSRSIASDHYLGKETVQNILVFRLGNSIFEPLWNRRYVDHVQITAAEERSAWNTAPATTTNRVPCAT